MGQQVLTRKSALTAEEMTGFQLFETLSKWADITLYDIGIDDYRSDEAAEVILGRAEPLLAQNLRQRLGRTRNQIRIYPRKAKMSALAV